MNPGKLLVVVLLALLANVSFAQNQDAPGPERYVIVGVFRVMDNAVRFTEKANKANFSAGYIQNPRNKLYYVYLFQSLETKKAFAFMMKLRLETEYKEAWVYKGSLGEPIQEPVAQEQPKVEPPKVEPPKEEPKKEEPKVEEPKVEPPKEQPKEETPAPVVETPKETPPPVVEETPKVDPNVPTMEPKPVGKPFFFKLTSNDTGEPLEGEIHIFDRAVSTYQAYPANQIVYLPAPRDASQVYAISTLAAGYQEMQRPLNYADPASSAAEVGSNSEFVIALPLIHAQLGDYIEFSNVRFLSNSVLLQPSSKDELDGLAELMKQNPRYKIAIHGHCNGDQDRNIIVRAPNADFFTASAGNQRRTVSAKEFTELRAELVRDYLVSQGVEGKRISAKGEGGKALIYPTNSTLAGRNDRVEVEVKRGK